MSALNQEGKFPSTQHKVAQTGTSKAVPNTAQGQQDACPYTAACEASEIPFTVGIVTGRLPGLKVIEFTTAKGVTIVEVPRAILPQVGNVLSMKISTETYHKDIVKGVHEMIQGELLEYLPFPSSDRTSAFAKAKGIDLENEGGTSKNWCYLLGSELKVKAMVAAAMVWDWSYGGGE